jgi:cytidylate kinase
MTQTKRVTVAIDGPAGAGKSTVAKEVARRLGYAYVDTGAMYRAVALLGARRSLAPTDEAGFIAEAASAEMEFRNVDGAQRFFVNREDVTEAVRRPDIGALSSPVSAIPEVRRYLTETQRRMAQGGGVVLEGRDIGTVVCPQAEAKFFVTASPEERARRRCLELRAKGIETDLAAVRAEMADRDRRDSSRAVAPLVKAPDAIEVVTDGLSIEEVVARIIARVSEVASQ